MGQGGYTTAECMHCSFSLQMVFFVMRERKKGSTPTSAERLAVKMSCRVSQSMMEGGGAARQPE